MNPTTLRFPRTVLVGIGLVIATLAIALVLNRVQTRTPPRPILAQVADFTLTNQFGQVVTVAGLRGKVWVADIIFSRCAGPCPRMTRQMRSLQDALTPTNAVKLLTLTTDPEFDTPAVLHKYADRFNADPDRWLFLTGTKSQIAALAIDSLKLTAIEKKPEERTDADDLFIHSTIFVVLDKQARLRGVFETGGDGIEWTNVQSEILTTVRQLEREP